MISISVLGSSNQRRETRAACSACRPLRPGVKIAQLLEGIGAEHFAVSLAELWSLPIGEKSLETVTGKI